MKVMSLTEIKDFYPQYKDDFFGGKDFNNYSVYAGRSEDKIGSLDNILVDESGRFRYYVIDTGIWIFGKKVLLPVGCGHFDYTNERIYALGIKDKDQLENLPSYDEATVVDYDYEEQVRAAYRTQGATTANYNRDNYSYDYDADLYNTNEENFGNLKLYEEHLIADKKRQKTGEVTVGKKVKTAIKTASVPVEKEKIVVKRTTPNNVGKAVNPSEANFSEGEVARMEVYEETAEIKKEAFVREEVTISKEVEHDTVTARETLRREELAVETDGKPVVER